MNQWQTAELGLQSAWQVTQGAPSAIVAIIDTGVQRDHPSLRGRVLPGYNALTGAADASDDNGHGTSLAGIVAAACPRCSILPVKALDQNAVGDYSTIAAGVRWAVDHDAQVINLSVGAPRAVDPLPAAISYALGKGVIVVAAAGNAGLDQPYFPAVYPGVVSVAGIDQERARYSWSNFGNWVTVAAPGCATTSSLGGATTPNFCGTSAAAPFVAGVAGLARTYRPQLRPPDFIAALRASANPLPDPAVTAFGCVDANRMLIAIGAPPGKPVESRAPAISRTPVLRRRILGSLGRWRDASSYTVQWQRSRNGTTWGVVGRLRAYTPTRFDLGYRLRIVVSAVNARGVMAAASAATDPVRSS